MDYETLRAGIAAAIPFNNTIGLEVTDLVEVTLSNGDDETVVAATVQWHVRERS